MVRMWSSPCRRDGEVEKSVLRGGYILSFLRKERLGEKGGAFLNGKEGFCPLEGEPKGSKRLLKVGFRKKSFLAGETER